MDSGKPSVLCVGESGQVALAMRDQGIQVRGLAVRCVGRAAVDLAVPGRVRDFLLQERPDVVVNAAAWTDVNGAETAEPKAHRLNADAVGEMAEAASEIGARLVHLSTDYVFDGSKSGFYLEDDLTGPLNAYGRTKLEGERQARARSPDSLILRTSWVYAPWGNNFVRTMLKLAAQRTELTVVADQSGCPTSAIDIAQTILTLIQKPEVRGTYHVAAPDAVSWADFARCIFEISSGLGGPSAAVIDVAAEAYTAKMAGPQARRPANSRLSTIKLAQDTGIVLPSWQDSLRACINRIAREGWPA